MHIYTYIHTYIFMYPYTYTLTYIHIYSIFSQPTHIFIRTSYTPVWPRLQARVSQHQIPRLIIPSHACKGVFGTVHMLGV